MSIENPSRAENMAEGVIITNPLENPRVFSTADRKIFCICGTDQGFGYKEKNEDSLAITITEEWIAFVVGDGVGGDPDGAGAAQHVAKSFTENVTQTSNLSDFHTQTHQRMKAENFLGSGAAYVVARLTRLGDQKKLEISPVGDAQLMVVGKDGNIRHLTKAKRQRRASDNKEFLMQWVIGDELTPIDQPYEFDLEPGDRIVAASDFLWDNFKPEEVAKLIQKKSIEEAFRILSEESKKKMESGELSTKPDNRTLLILDI